MKVQLIPALDDNYMYLLIDEESKECAAVDPVEPQKIMEAVKEGKVKLSQILTTHHHWDHAGGNDKLVSLAGKLEVRGADDRIDGLTHKMKDGDVFKLGSLQIRCIFTPCHTSGHVCYFVEGAAGEQPAVFTGDTLFVGGCGKFFEGTGQNMYDALVQKLSKLPSDSRVYCGHEYTVSNLKFAAHVEPGNQDLSKKLQWAQSQVKQQKPTIPSTIGEELSYNPFMRVGVESVQKHIGQEDPVSVMGALRQAKNSFRPT